jgi:hypothetical protein
MAAQPDELQREVKFFIRKQSSHVYAEMHGRETGSDMKEFLLAVKAACQEHGCPKILLCVRDSRAMFKAEDYGLAGQMGQTGGQASGPARGYVSELVTPACRIALVGDTSELNYAHEYIELVARQQQVNVKSFRDSASAARWLDAEQAAEAAGAQAPGLDALQPGRAPKLA